MEVQEEVLIQCSIGLSTNSRCHLTSYASQKGFKQTKEFSAEQQQLLCQRSGFCLSEDSKICFHHKAMFLDKYEFLQKFCCNPFNIKNHSVKKGLWNVNAETAVELKLITKKEIKPGQKICPTCRKQFANKKSIQLQSHSSHSDDEAELEYPSDALNTSLTAIGISPLKFQKISKRDSKGYAKRKISETQHAIVHNIAAAGGFDPKDVQTPSTSKMCPECSDHRQLIKELKEKLHLSKHSEKLQILTLVPQSWTIKETMQEFGVSERMVKTARKLKAENGILAMPKDKSGKKIAEAIKQRVVMFYHNEEFSRICPGKKDCVSIRVDGEKVTKQKYLLLNNLKEIFAAYRIEYGHEIGFSKFCELRPKWCVTVGAAGTHSVCVCTMHQNVKLMLSSSPIKEDYKVLIAKTVCDIESKDCMLRRCDVCPGKESLQEFLEHCFEDYDPEDTIEFKQWVHTDRDTLETKQMTIDDFIDDLITKVSKLSSHHYIAKHQSKHLKCMKERLKPYELIILMDFAENYSFIVQDAAQGYHWDNSQATLHPFVVYFKDNLDIKSFSYCVISDCLKHDTIAVHAFLVKLIEDLKRRLEKITHIAYFSDGSAAQYKNFKNFLNLCHHKSDFGISSEWNFFATSHGKSPCDGVGGTVKRLAARASLQRPTEEQILTATDLFEYCKKNIIGIEFIFISKEDIEEIKPGQEKRFENGCTVSGTRENHQFTPKNERQICIKRVSNDNNFFVTNVVRSQTAIHCVDIAALQPGQYIACIYDGKWWIGNVSEISNEENDLLINFMHPNGPSTSFYWPNRQDMCWVPEQHIISVISAPAATRMGRKYNLSNETLIAISNIFQEMNK